jgi:hypothetical protein
LTGIAEQLSPITKGASDPAANTIFFLFFFNVEAASHCRGFGAYSAADTIIR